MNEVKKIIANRDLVQRYLTNSRVILDSPGTLLTDLYYTEKNSTVDQLECEFTTGRYTQGLTSISFGSQGNVTIPNESFAGLMALHMELPDLQANTSLPRGWGYAAIDQIDFIMGGSNQGNVTLSGQSLFQVAMLQCLNSEKKSQVLKLGGEEKLAPDGTVSNATILIPMPFSSIQGLTSGHKKPYDTMILGNPISVNVRFKTAAEIYGGSGVKPTAFNSVTMLLRQGKLSNPQLGLAPLVKSSGRSYVYPFTHKQSAVFMATSVGGRLAFTFDQMINADLLSVIFGVVRTADLGSATNNNTPNPFNYVDCKNIDIKHNGQILMNCPGSSHIFFQCGQTNGATYWEGSYVSPGAITPFLSAPVNSNMIIMDLTQNRQENFEGHFQNSKSYSNQTMNFVCTVPTDESHTIFTTYIYNGMMLTTSQGTTEIYYN